MRILELTRRAITVPIPIPIPIHVLPSSPAHERINEAAIPRLHLHWLPDAPAASSRVVIEHLRLPLFRHLTRPAVCELSCVL